MNAASLFVRPQRLSIQQIENNTPELSSIMENLQYHFSEYKYTVYRCAAKVVALQKALHTVRIPYKFAMAVLERRMNPEGELSTLIPPFHLTAFLKDLFLACEKLGHFSESVNYDREAATWVLANFLWNMFDPCRRYSVSMLELKVSLILLCKIDGTTDGQLSLEFYELLCNRTTKCIVKRNFERFVMTLCKFFAYLGESSAYGECNKDLVLNQTFGHYQNANGLTEYQFFALWSSSHTRFIIYANLMALIKRLEEMENLVHTNSSCSGCHCEQIIGIRFKCQTCKSLSLCMQCFATGYATNKHASGHRMYEVFMDDDDDNPPPKKFTHFFSKICQLFVVGNGGGSVSNDHNNDCKEFCRPHKNDDDPTIPRETQTVIVANDQPSTTEQAMNLVDMTPPKQAEETENHHSKANTYQLIEVKNSFAYLSAAASNAQSISDRLQLLITRLLKHNSQVERQLAVVRTTTREELGAFLIAHKQFMVEIIKEMRTVTEVQSSQYVSLGMSSLAATYPTASTPFRPFTESDPKNNSLLSSVVNPLVAMDGNLTHSIYGAEINRSYLEANRSDFSLKDVSFWFSKDPRLRRQSLPLMHNQLEAKADAVGVPCVTEMHETELSNFRLLLGKVKGLLESSTYNKNGELTEATQNLENVLDSIINKRKETSRSIG